MALVRTDSNPKLKLKVEIVNHTAGGQNNFNKPGTQLTFYKEKVGPNHHRVFICHPDFKPDSLDQSKNPCKPTDCTCNGFLTTDSYILEVNEVEEEPRSAATVTVVTKESPAATSYTQETIPEAIKRKQKDAGLEGCC